MLINQKLFRNRLTLKLVSANLLISKPIIMQGKIVNSRIMEIVKISLTTLENDTHKIKAIKPQCNLIFLQILFSQELFVTICALKCVCSIISSIVNENEKHNYTMWKNEKFSLTEKKIVTSTHW